MQFSKMHGLGNDFMVIDGVTQSVFLTDELIRKLADRHRGVGFDQLLLVEAPYTTVFLTLTAVRFLNVSMARVVLPALSASKD